MNDQYTFGGKYRLEQEIANGGCGTVFLGVHTVAGKEVAIKLEAASSHQAHRNVPSPLKQESKIYKSLMGGPGVPWIMWSGRKGDYNVMVIDLLGPSLEDLFKMCNRHFSLKTVLLLADQLISRIAFIHSKDLVHRDIKPANFVMGTGKSAHLVNVIDFGLAKKFRDPRTGLHIPYRQDSIHGVGTSLFASINTHMGIECSRRDDLESLSYMLIYFLRGTLPWRKIRYQPPSSTPMKPSPPSPPTIPSDPSKYSDGPSAPPISLSSPPQVPGSRAQSRNRTSSRSRSRPPSSQQLANSHPSLDFDPCTPSPSEIPRSPPHPVPPTPQKSRPVPSFHRANQPVHNHPLPPPDTPATPQNLPVQTSAKDAVNPVTATWNLILTAKLAAESTLTVGLPAEFDVFHRYARSLAFDDLPDYDGLRRLLRGLGRRLGVCYGEVLEGEEGVDENEQLIDDDGCVIAKAEARDIRFTLAFRPTTTNVRSHSLRPRRNLQSVLEEMDGWSKISQSIGNINLSQSANKFAKGFNSSVQATRERLGQIAPEEITELPQEYKDLEARVDALRNAHISILKITNVYESETYDYPTHIQESISELSTSIGYGITNFAAANFKGTNLPAPSPVTPPAQQHKTLPHALGRAATTAAQQVQGAHVSSAGSDDKLGKALALYASGWDKIAAARLHQDASIQSAFLYPWQQTLNTSIAVAMKARQAVKVSRLELDAAKQSLKSASAARQEQARLEVENAEDDLVQKTEVAITLMKTVLDNPEPIKNLNELVKAQLLFFATAAESLSGIQGEIEELSVAAEGEYRKSRDH
ncbi:hypothetical protein ONZ45_g1767 [Pleurotus djamor]|nr:hypothetical protein ONZ45_g1767 [Pleurotus djamor]